MKVEVKKATLKQKPILNNLLELYQYDIAEYANNGWRDIGSDGRYGYKYLDDYWSDQSRTPFLVWVDEKLAGFVLVNEHVCLKQPPGTKSIAEFFIMRKYRGQDVGRLTAFAVFDTFPGHWEVAQDKMNPSAQKFWMRVVDDYTEGKFEKEIIENDCWNGPIISFKSIPKSKHSSIS